MKIKSKINKAETLRQLRELAENKYRNTYDPDAGIDAFMDGVESLFEKLCLEKNNSNDVNESKK